MANGAVDLGFKPVAGEGAIEVLERLVELIACGSIFTAAINIWGECMAKFSVTSKGKIKVNGIRYEVWHRKLMERPSAIENEHSSPVMVRPADCQKGGRRRHDLYLHLISSYGGVTESND